VLCRPRRPSQNYGPDIFSPFRGHDDQGECLGHGRPKISYLTTSTQYPDVVSLMQEIFASDPELRSFIIDSEIVAIDSVNGTLKTFQELSSRARKDVQIHDIKVAVGIFAFDLMYLDGEASSIFCDGTFWRLMGSVVDTARTAVPKTQSIASETTAPISSQAKWHCPF
jgi:hypothetical protein